MQRQKMSQRVESDTAEVTSVDPRLQQMLNQSIRDQLNQSLSQVSDGERQLLLKQSVLQLTENIIHNNCSHDEWVDLYSETHQHLMSSYREADLSEEEKNQSNIIKTGLVMSVEYSTGTFNDIYRVNAFIRGAYQAINNKENQETIHIVYPACGPFAPLLIPLISYVQQKNINNKIKISLIDIQPGAIKALDQLINDLGVREYIHELECMDIMDYNPGFKIDILILEAMQHGITREGHLFFARHLAQFMTEDSILLPEEITVNAYAGICQTEFATQWDDQDRTHSSLQNEQTRGYRQHIGKVITLTLKNIKDATTVSLGESIELIEGDIVTIPVDIGSDKALLLFTTITVFNNEKISEYDSGITQPIYMPSVCMNFKPKAPQPDDLLVKSGDNIRFYYKMDATPGFLPVKA
ncbi:hypothetical protein [Oceanospirillum sediminis]|uniref:Phytanoyl-CoA dioxygenase n=1 Tax=Oceanospirillum sediminis TaxID=2760088 RepID=A0A839IM04_9GAMM|nr:hypothetical protein [Oceanospirillum sediminis]MBB1485529.1 hypothetical protein [Oceanospirillum sediminis]